MTSTPDPVFGKRLMLVLCDKHGNAMGEVVESSLGAFFRSRFPMSAPEFWRDGLAAERSYSGRRVRSVRITVWYLIEQGNWADTPVPPPWITPTEVLTSRVAMTA